MLKRIVKLELREDMIDTFVSVFREKEHSILAFEGCVEVGIYKDVDNYNTYFTYSVWLDNTYLLMYRQSPFFRETWTEAKKCFSSKAAAWSIVKL